MSDDRASVATSIASFAWDDFGLDVVGQTIRDGSTEWVAALADRIVRNLLPAKANPEER